MSQWKHLINLIIYSLVSAWNFILIKYLEFTGKNCTLNTENENFRKTAIVISWIIFSITCVGAFVSILELVGILHTDWKISIA